MELRQLEYFMAVCEEMHFTRAAEKLNIAQPTLSQQIKSLEGEIGIPLFDRIGKRIALTEAGKILLDHCRRIFYEVEQAQLALRDLNGLGRGKLAVGTLLTCVSYLLPPAILQFKQLYPNIELSVFGMRSGEIEKGIMENELDLGITFLPVENEEMESIPLFTEELSLAVPITSSLATETEVGLETLKDVPIVLLPQNYFLRQLIEKYCNEIGFSPNPTLEMTTLESLMQMVAEGVGVTILPAPYLDYLSNDRIAHVKLCNPTPTRTIGFVYRKNKFMCTATRAFMQQVIETSQRIESVLS